LKNSITKVLVEWLKVKVLSSNLSTARKRKNPEKSRPSRTKYWDCKVMCAG
jgi:hypothetical protein